MANETKLSFPGQCILNKLSIINHSDKETDIRPMAGVISLYEDIFSHVMSGNMILEDGQDLIHQLPMVGQEFLDIEVLTAGMEDKHAIKKRFYIYKISNIEVLHDNSQRYIIHFISHEAIQDINIKFSQSWGGRISSNIVKIVNGSKYLNSSKHTVLEETSNSLAFISNYWSPFETISYMSHRAMTTNKNHPSYLFFETNKNFAFMSLQKMYAGETFCEYIFSKVTRDAAGIGSEKANDKMMQKILNFEYKTGFDYIQRSMGGMHSGVLMTHNLLTKTIKTTTFDYLNTWDKEEHTEQYPIVSPSLIRTPYTTYLARDNIHYVYGNQISDKFQLWLLKRRSVLSQLNAINLDIEVYGRTDLEIGKLVKLTVPLNQPMNKGDTDKLNQYMTGKYLVTAIHHRIHNGAHRMNLNIAKESFAKEIVK